MDKEDLKEYIDLAKNISNDFIENNNVFKNIMNFITSKSLYLFRLLRKQKTILEINKILGYTSDISEDERKDINRTSVELFKFLGLFLGALFLTFILFLATNSTGFRTLVLIVGGIALAYLGIQVMILNNHIKSIKHNQNIEEADLNIIFHLLIKNFNLKTSKDILLELRNAILTLESATKDKEKLFGEFSKEPENIDLFFDSEKGCVLTMQVSLADKFIKSHMDSILNGTYIIPYFDQNREKVMYSNNSVISFSIDEIILALNGFRSNFGLKERYEVFKELPYNYYFDDLKELKEQQEFMNQFKDSMTSTNAKYVFEKIKHIRKNKDNYNFNVWNSFSEGIEGNNSYVSIKCLILNNKPMSDIEKLKGTLETSFRKTVIFKKNNNDKGSFNLIIILKETLDKFTMTVEQLAEYNQNNMLFLGKSWTGNIVAEWNYQANHISNTGKSGSGKSEKILSLITQLQQMKDFKYLEMYIMSSSKVADFTAFKENGALVVGDSIEDFGGLTTYDRIELTLEFLLKKLKMREAIFESKGVKNIKDYNKKYPENPMNLMIILIDEYENLLKINDTKQRKNIENLTISLLNIARSSGATMIIGAQSLLKQDIGATIDKMTVKISGSNEPNILNQIDSEVADYYRSLDNRQGVFMLKADNLDLGNKIEIGKSGFTLIQTPLITNISSKTLNKLSGAENLEAILSQSEDYSSSEDVEETFDDFDTEDVEEVLAEEQDSEVPDMSDFL